MVIIIVYQSLSNSSLYENICLENIKKLYKSYVKFDDQHQHKAIIETSMVFTPKGFTDNSPISSGQYVPSKQPSARKFLSQFIETLDVKAKTALRGLLAAKSKRKAIIIVSKLCSSIPKQCIYTKINECV